MKKILAVLLALSVLFAFAACGGGSEGEEAQGVKKLTGEWHLYTEGVSDPTEAYTFNEDGTGVRVRMRGLTKEVNNFTYTDEGTVITLNFENDTTLKFNYTLEVDKLILDGKTFVRPVNGTEGE